MDAGKLLRTAVLCAALVPVTAACGSSAPSGTGPDGSATRTAQGGLPSARAPSPTASGSRSPAPGAQAGTGLPPPPAHTVIVVLENRSYDEVIGNPSAPFINSLARRGALFTDSHAVAHPSEPNYLALFSGGTQGVTDDSCPHRFSAANLASQLMAAHLTFAGYSEGLPQPGSAVCSAGGYARKHVPWTDFTNVPASASQPFSRFPAGDFARLPTVSFVIPDLCHDMHDCPVKTGDAWLATHLGGYAAWARTHDSLLVVTWDENDGSPGNQIATIFDGQRVRPGRYAMRITHYSVLHTVEKLYGLPPTGHAANAPVIGGIWN